MSRPVIYGHQMRIYLTAEHRSAVLREAALLGVKPSVVIRAALTAYFDRADEPNQVEVAR